MYFVDFHRFQRISIDFHGFPLISMDLRCSWSRVSAPLWRPVAACAAGLDPPSIKISDSGGLEAWVLDAGRIARIGGWWLLDRRRGLEEIPTRSR